MASPAEARLLRTAPATPLAIPNGRAMRNASSELTAHQRYGATSSASLQVK